MYFNWYAYQRRGLLFYARELFAVDGEILRAGVCVACVTWDAALLQSMNSCGPGSNGRNCAQYVTRCWRAFPLRRRCTSSPVHGAIVNAGCYEFRVVYTQMSQHIYSPMSERRVRRSCRRWWNWVAADTKTEIWWIIWRGRTVAESSCITSHRGREIVSWRYLRHFWSDLKNNFIV